MDSQVRCGGRGHCLRPAGLRVGRGFTLIELLVVGVLLAVTLGLAIPTLQHQFTRARFEGVAREVSLSAQTARATAVRRHVPVIMTIDVGTSTLTSFVDVDNDGTFNPVAGAPQGTTDWELGRMEVIGEIFLGGPAGDPAIIDGFDGGAPIATATFRPDGTVDNAGAIRLADGRDNFLEVRIAPQGTARIELRKWDDSRPPNEQGSNWYARREGGQAWRWST